MFPEQRGTAAHHGAHRPDPRRDHAAIGQDPKAHRHVDMVVDQVDDPVAQHQPDVDFGKQRQEIGNDRQHMQTAEQHGRGEHEITARRGEFAGGLLLGFVHLLEDAPRRRRIGDAGIGQGQLAGAARQELRAEQRFEIGDFSAERRHRHPHGPCGGRQAALVERGEEHRHGFETVHRFTHPTVRCLSILSD